MYWADGKSYDGDWLTDQMHGMGAFTDQNGETKKGEWRDGVIYQWMDGTK